MLLFNISLAFYNVNIMIVIRHAMLLGETLRVSGARLPKTIAGLFADGAADFAPGV
jgi:hypothetical protein